MIELKYKIEDTMWARHSHEEYIGNDRIVELDPHYRRGDRFKYATMIQATAYRAVVLMKPKLSRDVFRYTDSEDWLAEDFYTS